MKARTFALVGFVTGLLAASYLCWAWHRVTGAVLISDAHVWPRPFPYPDQWLGWWEQRLDAAHPVSPGFIKLDGEFQRLQTYLSGWIGLSLIISFGSLVWLIILRKRDRDA
jgi:hypothetical protein